jgi:two-component system cell cycle sensor histidine kinase/response regulator CckA
MATEIVPPSASNLAQRTNGKVIPASHAPKTHSPLEKLGDSNIVGITFSRKDGQIINANDEFLRMVGYSREDLEAGRLNWTEMTPPDWSDADQKAITNFAETGKVSVFEKEYLCKDGSRVPVLIGIIAMHGADREALSFVVDISERKRGESELRRSEERYRSIVENTHEGICVCDSQRTVTYCNPRLVNLLGYGEAEPCLQCDQIHFEEDRAEIEHRFERQRSGLSESYGKRLRRKDGSALWVSTSASPVYDDHGGFAGSLCMFNDVTERKRLEEELLQSQKIQAIGQLAGGIAHDFNNLLTVILGHCGVMERKLSESPMLKSVVEVRRAGERAAQFTQQLLAFSRKQVLRPRVISMNQLVQDTEVMLRRLIGEDIELADALDPEVGNIRADPGQIEQVLLNLSINARDAMANGGRLLIETQRQELDAAAAALRSLPAGRYVALSVTDTGCGMDEPTRGRIFEPFFTTKAPGVGTGLGLSTVLGIIHQSGGSISVDSTVSVGTTFKIYLPLVEEAAALGEMRQLTVAPAAGETVLIVEDDPSIRTLAADVLREHGYRVLEAGHAEEAVIACELCPGLKLLLTDVVMRGMNGHELADLLLASRPTLKVLYMSGYSEKGVAQQGTFNPGGNFLQKPFRPEELLCKVGEVLSKRSTSTKVLIVDDDIQVRTFLASLLETEGYTVLQAADGKQGQALCDQGEIALLITDLVMPGQEGLETIHAIRHHWPKLPIIAISGAFGGAYLELAKKLGAQAVIRKPFQLDAILSEVRRLTHCVPHVSASC